MMQSEDGYLQVCLHCYNKDMAESVGIDYDHIELQPISLKDIDGNDHKFEFHRPVDGRSTCPENTRGHPG